MCGHVTPPYMLPVRAACVCVVYAQRWPGLAGGVGGVMDGMAWGGLCAAGWCVDGLQWPKVIHALGVMLSMCLCACVCVYVRGWWVYVASVCAWGGLLLRAG